MIPEVSSELQNTCLHTCMYIHIHSRAHTHGQVMKKKADLLLVGCLLDLTSDNLLCIGSVVCLLRLYILGASLGAEEHMIWHVSSSLGGT